MRASTCSNESPICRQILTRTNTCYSFNTNGWKTLSLIFVRMKFFLTSEVPWISSVPPSTLVSISIPRVLYPHGIEAYNQSYLAALVSPRAFSETFHRWLLWFEPLWVDRRIRREETRRELGTYEWNSRCVRSPRTWEAFRFKFCCGDEVWTILPSALRIPRGCLSRVPICLLGPNDPRRWKSWQWKLALDAHFDQAGPK